MYYAVLRKEIKMPCSGGVLTLNVGGVYELRKSEVMGVPMCLYRSVDTLGFDGDTEFGDSYGPWYEMTVEDARDTYFTRHYCDFNDAIEESFLVCEAEYC